MSIKLWTHTMKTINSEIWFYFLFYFIFFLYIFLKESKFQISVYNIFLKILKMFYIYFKSKFFFNFYYVITLLVIITCLFLSNPSRLLNMDYDLIIFL